MGSFKPTVWLEMNLFAMDDGSIYIVADEIDRRRWFSTRKRYDPYVDHFYEGNEKLVWCRFECEDVELPSRAQGLEYVSAWFSGHFKKLRLSDEQD